MSNTNGTSATVPVTTASKMTGKGRNTIYRHIKQGKLSSEQDADGNVVVQVAELERRYGKLETPGTSSKLSQSDPVEQAETSNSITKIKLLEQEIKFLNEKLEDREERIEEIRQREEELKEEKASLSSELAKEREANREMQKMLTYQPNEEKPKSKGWWPFRKRNDNKQLQDAPKRATNTN